MTRPIARFLAIAALASITTASAQDRTPDKWQWATSATAFFVVNHQERAARRLSASARSDHAAQFHALASIVPRNGDHGGDARDLIVSNRGTISVGGDVTGYHVAPNLRESYGSRVSYHKFVRLGTPSVLFAHHRH